MEELVITPKREKKQYIWAQKYRPDNLSGYIGNALIKETFSKFIENQDCCNILLYGPPGTGKTSLAKLLVKEMVCDFIYINASDERGIDIIRDKIKGFASSSGFKPLKIVILDEADGMTPIAQGSLKPIMEMYSMNTRFILTSNFAEKITGPIQSRCQSFELLPPSRTEVAVHLTEILKKENIVFTPEELAIIINVYYPDIRKVIQVSQQSSLNGILKVSRANLIEYDIKTKIVEMLRVRKSSLEIRQYVIDQNLNRFDEIYTHLYENVDKYAEGKQAAVILKIADAVLNDTFVAHKQIVFMACIIEILKSLKV
jgi:DNA polymerase III delta prime subunit